MHKTVYKTQAHSGSYLNDQHQSQVLKIIYWKAERLLDNVIVETLAKKRDLRNLSAEFFFDFSAKFVWFVPITQRMKNQPKVMLAKTFNELDPSFQLIEGQH